MKITTSFWIIGLAILCQSCAEINNAKYTDTRELEIPPQMEIKKKKTVVDNSEKLEKKGLGESVILAEKAGKPLLKIKKTFSRSWNIVRQALQISEIEITDKNRESGVFYVLYDPDKENTEESGFFDSMTFFLFKDDYKEAPYKLTVGWEDSDTEVTVEQMESKEIDLLDDDGDDFDSSVDNGQRLINSLYKTIRDDLPLK